MAKKRTEHLFLVRLWREGGTDRTPWRGSVDHLATGGRQYFTALEELSRYIEAHTRGSAALERDDQPA